MKSIALKHLGRVRLILWTLIAATMVAMASFYFFDRNGHLKTLNSGSSGEAAVHSDFSLIDHNGRRVTESDFLGRWQLVFFGFTHCPDICPTTLAYVSDVMAQLGRNAERLVPLFITVDPERDTPEVMAEYVQAFHPDLIGLTGSLSEVDAAAKAFRVYYERSKEDSAPGGYLMSHSGYIYLMTPEGRFGAVFREGDSPSQEVASEIALWIEGAGG